MRQVEEPLLGAVGLYKTFTVLWVCFNFHNVAAI